MPRPRISAIALLAAWACCAGCSPRPLVPEPGPLYSTARTRQPRVEVPADARSAAAAAWLRSRNTVDLGTVEYDGLTLPVVSPDANFLAVQTGPTPAWNCVLAEPDAPPIPNVIAVTRILPDQPEPRALIATLPAGVMLGRTASSKGFLVELPATKDLPRRIGMADWETGRIEQLTDDAGDSAFGVVGAGGELAYSRRGRHESRWSLVLRAADGQEYAASIANASIVFPQIVRTSTETIVFAMIAADASGGPLRLAAFAPGAVEQDTSLLMLASVEIATSATMFDAYQAVAACQSLVQTAPNTAGATTVVFSSATQSVVVAHLVLAPTPRFILRPLVPGTFSGTLTVHNGRPGVLACTYADVVYQDLGTIPAGATVPEPSPDLVWPEAGVVRRTERPEWPYLALFMKASSTPMAFRGVLVSGRTGSKASLIGF